MTRGGVSCIDILSLSKEAFKSRVSSFFDLATIFALNLFSFDVRRRAYCIEHQLSTSVYVIVGRYKELGKRKVFIQTLFPSLQLYVANIF